MIIRKGFVQTMIGEWINMSNIYAFSFKLDTAGYILVALMDKDDDLGVELGPREYETDEEAQEALDYAFYN